MTIGPAELAEILRLPPPTDEQVAVIAARLSPALVVAGAGSGKTETMAARVVYLVANGLADPGQVLGLTFTRKAAAELAARVRRRLQALADAGVAERPRQDDRAGADPAIGTYHSFAGRLIGEFGPLAGIEPPARVLTATGSWQLARSVVGRWDGDLHTDVGPERVTQDVLAIAGALADHLATPDSLTHALDELLDVMSAAAPGPRQRSTVHSGLTDPLRQLAHRRAVVPLVLAYDAAKRAAGAVDFADQMQLAARIVAAAPLVGMVLRDRHRVVLLDEYQDTGHAQRVILRTLFGDPADGSAPAWRGHPVTAVGDPVQSIYGWRGASASNLPRFATDFPAVDGSPASTLGLLTSFRNASLVLDLANVASAPVRGEPVPVGELRPRPGAPIGAVRTAVAHTVEDENAWLADTLATIWADEDAPPSTAVLLRRRADMPAVAAALRERGLPVEVVGVGGLVDEPEVADVIAVLRMVVDHEAGPAAVRVLTGARWRLGLADLAALARRGRQLQVRRGRGDTGHGHSEGGVGGEGVPGGAAALRLRRALAEAVGGEDVDLAGLVDAIADPGPAQAYSTEGYRRVTALGGELRRIRARLPLPLVDLVVEIERVTGLDVEALLTPDGRAHLDAFAQVVAEVAATGAGPVELLDHLATAAEREDGLAPGTVQPVPGRVQVLTVHGAKGLEWDVVALPHLCAKIFPGERTTTWLGDAGRLPPQVRGDRDDLPELVVPPGADQSALVAALRDHVAALGEAQRTEERRLFYVALTRARHTLLLSAHHWGATGARPRGPGPFLLELAGHPALADPEIWADPPAADDRNPLTDDPRTAVWPVDPLRDTRTAVEKGADRVLRALARLPVAGADPPVAPDGSPGVDSRIGSADGDAGREPPVDGRKVRSREITHVDAQTDDVDGWRRDVDLLLAERASARGAPVLRARLPGTVSVSSLVDLAADPQRLARRLRRPVPVPPAPQARRGTAFHAWLERHFAGDPLLDLDELPGARDRDAAPDAQLPELVDAFRRSAWADRAPLAVEVPFVTRIAGLTVRGRIDAVFTDPDGGATVLDWKTGAPPEGDRARNAAVQLAAYRLAWSRLTGLPLASVRAAFHYVAADRTVHAADLLDEDGLERLVAAATADDVEAPVG